MPADTREFTEKIAPDHLAPLWNVMHSLVRPEPGTGTRPWKWDYAAVRSHLMEAGELISAMEAERRVLIYENPGLPGQSRITNSLYAGLQLVMPGEIAPAHRHTQSALRFVIEGSGAHTTVNGEKTIMRPGDFVITPHWAWHDHGNDSDEPMIWLDGLDIPLLQFLDASFAERMTADAQSETVPSGLTDAQFSNGLLPVDHRTTAVTSPVFNYPYSRTRESLYTLSRQSDPDNCHGYKLRYTNPVNGDYAMPTIATFMQSMPTGFASHAYRSTDATVYVVVEGHGKTRIGDETIEWQPKDIFVVPSWFPVSHNIDEEAVLFSFSDRVVQEKLGLWKESREEP
ncbi:MAG: gentisate 1,2-dioxygenase [Pseudomonadota bacterium]